MTVYSTHLRLPMATVDQTSWATIHQKQANMISAYLAGATTLAATGGTSTLADVDGTIDSSKKSYLVISGTLTSNQNVNVPARRRYWLIYNNTSGSFTVTVKTASGSGIKVKQGYRQWLYCDGTNVVAVSRLDGRATATEYGIGSITASHLATGAITTAKLATGAVTAGKIGSTGSFGEIIYTSTGSGFPWTNLARGSANQQLAMSTDSNPLPKYRDSAFRKAAFSTGLTISAGNNYTYAHGITGISNTRSYRHIRLALECISTDGGYAAGDVIYWGGNDYGAAGGGFTVASVSATGVTLVVAAAGLPAFRKNNQAAFALDLSKWRLYVGVFV